MRGRAQSPPARTLYRQWLLLALRTAGRAQILSPRQQGLSRLGAFGGIHRAADAGDLPGLQRTAAEVSPGRAWARRSPAARPLARPRRRAFRSPADLVPAVRRGGDRRRPLSAPCRDAAADGDVPLLGLAERLAAPDPRAQPALHEPPDCRTAGAP